MIGVRRTPHSCWELAGSYITPLESRRAHPEDWSCAALDLSALVKADVIFGNLQLCLAELVYFGKVDSIFGKLLKTVFAALAEG